MFFLIFLNLSRSAQNFNIRSVTHFHLAQPFSQITNIMQLLMRQHFSWPNLQFLSPFKRMIILVDSTYHQRLFDFLFFRIFLVSSQNISILSNTSVNIVFIVYSCFYILKCLMGWFWDSRHLVVLLSNFPCVSYFRNQNYRKN